MSTSILFSDSNFQWNTALDSNSAVPLEQLWILREETDGNLRKTFKYVQNQIGGATDIENGDAVTYVLTDDGWYQVTTLASADGASAAGIGISTITDQYYGWIQVAWFHTAAKIKWDTDATTAWGLIWTSATAKKLWGGTKFGSSYAQDAVASDTTGTVFLRWLI